MILSQLTCPSCNLVFKDTLFTKDSKNSIQLDKTYYYDFVQLFCPNCKQQICIFCYDKPILWNKKDQYAYSNFITTKNSLKFLNKKFLYLYYPIRNQKIVYEFLSYINFDKFDCVITTQQFSEKLVNFQKQLCVIPNYLFAHLQNTFLPNYFVQKIIIRQSQKFDKPILYSTYCTFFNCFQLLYKQKNWNVLKKYLNKSNMEM